MEILKHIFFDIPTPTEIIPVPIPMEMCFLFPFPRESHGNPIPTGNPIPMHTFNLHDL